MLTTQQEAAAVQYRAMRVVDLKQLLTEQGLSTSGLKEELVTRLAQNATSVDAEPAPLVVDEDTSTAVDEKAYRKMKVAELRDLLSEKGLAVEGKKDELIARLLSQSQESPAPETCVAVDEEIPVEPVCDESQSQELPAPETSVAMDEEITIEPVCDVDDLVDYEVEATPVKEEATAVVDITDGLTDQLASLAVSTKTEGNEVARLDVIDLELDNEPSYSRHSQHDDRDGKENAGQQWRNNRGKFFGNRNRYHMGDANGRSEERWGHDKYADRYEKPRSGFSTFTNLRTPAWIAAPVATASPGFTPLHGSLP